MDLVCRSVWRTQPVKNSHACIIGFRRVFDKYFSVQSRSVITCQNIAWIYDLQQSDATGSLEFVESDTLADILKKRAHRDRHFYDEIRVIRAIRG
jgi:hypothetical protein